MSEEKESSPIPEPIEAEPVSPEPKMQSLLPSIQQDALQETMSPVKEEEKILNQSREASPEITKDNFEEDALENDESIHQKS